MKRIYVLVKVCFVVASLCAWFPVSTPVYASSDYALVDQEQDIAVVAGEQLTIDVLLPTSGAAPHLEIYYGDVLVTTLSAVSDTYNFVFSDDYHFVAVGDVQFSIAAAPATATLVPTATPTVDTSIENCSEDLNFEDGDQYIFNDLLGVNCVQNATFDVAYGDVANVMQLQPGWYAYSLACNKLVADGSAPDAYFGFTSPGGYASTRIDGSPPSAGGQFIVPLGDPANNPLYTVFLDYSAPRNNILPSPLRCGLSIVKLGASKFRLIPSGYRYKLYDFSMSGSRKPFGTWKTHSAASPAIMTVAISRPSTNCYLKLGQTSVGPCLVGVSPSWRKAYQFSELSNTSTYTVAANVTVPLNLSFSLNSGYVVVDYTSSLVATPTPTGATPTATGPTPEPYCEAFQLEASRQTDIGNLSPGVSIVNDGPGSISITRLGVEVAVLAPGSSYTVVTAGLYQATTGPQSSDIQLCRTYAVATAFATPTGTATRTVTPGTPTSEATATGTVTPGTPTSEATATGTVTPGTPTSEATATGTVTPGTPTSEATATGTGFATATGTAPAATGTATGIAFATPSALSTASAVGYMSTAIAMLCDRDPCSSVEAGAGFVSDVAYVLGQSAGGTCSAPPLPFGGAAGEFGINAAEYSKYYCWFINRTAQFRNIMRIMSSLAIGYMVLRYFMRTMRRLGDV